MAKMQQYKTWETVFFRLGEAYVELSVNHQTKQFYIMHDNNDQNVTFMDSLSTCMDRAKCVTAALKYLEESADFKAPAVDEEAE